MPLVLQPDAIEFAKTQESSHGPKIYTFRLEALAQACLKVQSTFQLQDIDMLCGLNNLRKIFEFVSGKQGKAFRIDVELCNGTVMMTRWEHFEENMSQTSLCRGYGANFEVACTSQEERQVKSSSHHRIVSYSLGELNMVVQFEADACDCRCQAANDGTIKSEAQSIGPNAITTKEYSLEDKLPGRSPSPLNIVEIGEKHDPDGLIEIKSRDHKNRSLDDIMVQMWLSGRHRLYLGRHNRGRFDTNAIYQGDIDSDMIIWQRQHKETIVRFAGLLKQIQRKVMESAIHSEGGRFALVCERDKIGRKLTLWRRDGGQDFLRPETLARLQLHS